MIGEDGCDPVVEKPWVLKNTRELALSLVVQYESNFNCFRVRTGSHVRERKGGRYLLISYINTGLTS